jgi:predicted AAA+ superfamily ATPase
LGVNLTNIYKGALAEQFVGQELMAYREPYHKDGLYYWTREEKNSNAEIDYLIQKNGQIIPIEVKSGPTGRMKSMMLYKNAYHPELAVKISQAMYNDEKDILELPLYAIEYLIQQN